VIPRIPESLSLALTLVALWVKSRAARTEREDLEASIAYTKRLLNL
jgi:hypothetical protein